MTLDEEASEASTCWSRTSPDPAYANSEVRLEVQKAIDELNKGFARVEQLKKFAYLPRQLSIEGGGANAHVEGQAQQGQ